MHENALGLDRRRLLGALAGAAAAVPAAGLLSGGPAAAHGRRETVVRVEVTAQKISLSRRRVPAGVVHFEVSTPDAASIAPGIFRLRRGTGIDAFLTDYLAANSADLATKQRATARVDAEAEFLGGAAVTNVSPVRITVFLRPGTHWVFNYNAALTPYLADSILELQVGPQWSTGRAPRVDAEIVLRGRGFRLPAHLRGHGTYRVSNLTPQVNEAMWLGLTPDATDADVHDFWAAVLAGRAPAKNVVTSLPEGLAPLSAGRSGLITTALPPGRYLVTTFMYDRQNWVKGVFQDFWRTVTVH